MTSEKMFESFSLIYLDLFDPPKSSLERGTLHGLIPPLKRQVLHGSIPCLKRGAREDQTSCNTFQTSSDIKGIGIDIVSIPRIAQLIERYDRHTLTLLFTPGEIDRCQASGDCDRDFAICFATKEAIGKALGTGLVNIEWNDIEANFTPNQLTVELLGAASGQAKQQEIQTWLATWYEWDEHVLVHVLAL